MKLVRVLRYWNDGALATAIVATATEGMDWAAYIGATPGHYDQEETVRQVEKYGAKLLEEDARHFCPDEPLPYRR